MRKLALGLSIACFCLCFNNLSFASSTENENLNARIKSLQERLKEFQNREYKDHEEKLIVEEEGIDLILEEEAKRLTNPNLSMNIEAAERKVEELENRLDVAVTVLFHDNEYNGSYGANKNIDIIEPPKVIMEDSAEDRQILYDSLRKKVLQATRSGKMPVEEKLQAFVNLE
jgi:hypothetical protein